MAKTNKFILEYKEIVGDMEIESFHSTKQTIKRFIRLLKEVDDKRVVNMIDYPLEEIIMLVFLAVMGNANGWDEISLFGRENLAWLRKFLPYKNGIPSHDTIRRVFSLIKPEQLTTVTVAFLGDNITKIKKSLQIAPRDN